MYNKARPVRLIFIKILDFNHVFSIRREEKLLSAVATDIGRVIRILTNKDNTY